MSRLDRMLQSNVRPHRRAFVFEEAPPKRPVAFASDDELLQAAQQMFRARAVYVERADAHEREAEARFDAATAWALYWHASFGMSQETCAVAKRCDAAGLDRVEREIVAALLLEQLCLTDSRIDDCQELIAAMCIPGDGTIQAMRCLGDEGRLVKQKFIYYDDPDEDVRERRVSVDPALVDAVLCGSKSQADGWAVKTEDELYERMAELTRIMAKKAEALDQLRQRFGLHADVHKASRKLHRLLEGLRDTLELHPDWGVAKLMDARGWTLKEQIILLALVGKELGHIRADDELFKGVGLASAASFNVGEVTRMLQLLRADCTLVESGLVQPCAGSSEMLNSDDDEIAQTEFELTPDALGILGFDKRLIKRRSGRFQPRDPRVRLDQLVLTDETQQAIRMALTHAKHARTLTDAWGLGEIIPYGRSVVLLFHGHPGTGKTACAEALAHELDKPILMADYSEIQNCFVGQTEKNIVAMFRAAKAHDAVLLWDEADAMFYDRDSATRSWEVRDVNVLLQELEKFEGVCVLSTNRRIHLDRALERRIALKVEFPRPDRVMRRAIWEKLLPAKMPLAGDVSLDRLAECDLTGGEIKNAVLNAARHALNRNGLGPVAMEDLLAAAELETEGRWSADRGCRVGF